MKHLIFVLLTLGTSAARAAVYSVNLGFAGTRATAANGSVDARFNGRFGLGIDLALDERWTLVTGSDYVTRRVTWHRADGARLNVDFDYVDVPVDVRYRIANVFSAFAGFRFGINVLDKIETRAGTSDYDPVARAIITSGEIGLRVDLPYALAIDLFFEHEIGDGFGRGLSAYRTVGGRAVYRF